MAAFKLDDRLGTIADAHPYPLVFATVSGAHLYGFASPDSDWDLRGAHLLPATEVLGLQSAHDTIEKAQPPKAPGDLDLDFVTHDAAKFMQLMLKKNGYVLEQLFSPLIVRTSPEHEEMKAIAPSLITRHHAHHYLGFAATQWKLFSKEDPPRVKPLLYVYRVLLTGIHLMRTGAVEANLLTLNDQFRLPYVNELVRRKVEGAEASTLSGADLAFHRDEFARLESELKQAMDESSLPEGPAAEGREALSSLLVRMRLGTV